MSEQRRIDGKPTPQPGSPALDPRRMSEPLPPSSDGATEQRPLDHVIDSDYCITCPFCLHERWDDLYDISSDGQTTVVECGACERKFHVRVSVSVTYTSLIERPADV